MENIMTRTAAFTSCPTYTTTLTTPPFGMSSKTGLSAAPFQGIPVAGLAAVAVADQRPRNAKLGRPPRGELR